MKKILVSIVFSLILNTTVLTQWFWQNPLPTGNTLNAVDFLDNKFGIAVGDNGTIMKSTDGGTSWRLVTSNTIMTIHKIIITSGNVAYALGNSLVLKTTNGGENWFQLPNSPSLYLTDIYFFDDLKGFIVGAPNKIYFTDNGGDAWIERYSGTNGSISSIHFIDSLIGMAVGYSNYNQATLILKTVDGGITWNDYSSVLPPYYLFNNFLNVRLLNRKNALALSTGRIFYTSDGGISWSNFSVGSNSYFTSIAFLDSINGFISGYNGITGTARIFRTMDGGNNWQEKEINLGFGVWLLGITCPTTDFAFSVGESGRMIFSNDGGGNWLQTSSGFLPDLIDVSFNDEEHGIAVGLGGGMVVTSNGGRTWNFINNEGGRRCCMPSKNLAFSAGGYNLLKSNDGGITWTRHPVSNDDYFMTISFADTLNGLASTVWGQLAKIFRTFDGGETWQHISSIEGDAIYDICFVDSLVAYACTGATNVFKTTDGGYHWNSEYNTGVSGTILYGIHFVNRDVGYTVGYPGVVIKTTNGGDSWELLKPNLGNGLDFYQVHFKDENNGLVGGEIVAHTSDGGITWTAYQLCDDNIKSVAIVNDSIWYAVGLYGVILKSTNDGTTFIENENSIGQPNNFFLEQNYPNPFNPTTKISYQIPSTSLVQLNIYDILGKEVSTLVNEEKPTGNYEVEFRAENFSSGIYFYRLQVYPTNGGTGDFVETKKMILLK